MKKYTMFFVYAQHAAPINIFPLQIVAQGTACRAAANSCDVPEYCDGKSPTVSNRLFVKHCMP
jgi:hypothetical protein